MLPILRILPVGGVFLAILLIVLALKTPGERLRPLVPDAISARGPLIDRNDHPEWRQVLIQSALRRADELARLRELPDRPLRTEPPLPDAAPPTIAIPAPAPTASVDAPAQAPAPVDIHGPASATPAAPEKVAGLPTDRSNAEPDPDADSITGTADTVPAATIPVEIGEASSFELPVVLPEEKPPIIRLPERRPHESRRKQPPRIARGKDAPARTQRAPQTGLFESLFNTAQTERPAGGTGGSATTPPLISRDDVH